jgi:hypothetical protein
MALAKPCRASDHDLARLVSGFGLGAGQDHKQRVSLACSGLQLCLQVGVLTGDVGADGVTRPERAICSGSRVQAQCLGRPDSAPSTRRSGARRVLKRGE